MTISRPRPAALAALTAVLAAAVTAASVTPAAAGPTASGDLERAASTTGVPRTTVASTGLAPFGPTGGPLSRSAGTASTDATTTTTTDLTSSIATKLTTRAKDTRLGTAWSGQVVDLATGRAVWSRSTTTTRLPASNEKLITAYVAMKSLGGGATLTTSVLQGSRYKSSVYLKGVGDPTLTSARLKTMASTVASTYKAQGITAVKVFVDDSLFPAPTNATGWKAEWVPSEVAPVRALVVDQVNVMDTSVNAGYVLANQLRSYGLTVNGVGRAVVETGSTTVAGSTSPSVGSMVQAMLNLSQNDYAEALFRLAALKRGFAGDWTGARANALQVLQRYGVYTKGLVFYDGSGLSRSDRMPVTTALYLVKKMRTQPDVNSVVFASPGMPVAGVSGTLENRFTTAPTSCARSIVRAKTGSLDDVVTLSGIAQGKDGRERLFSLLVNANTATAGARAAVDALTATATGCY
ncbi:D-alanyl-D-alanine carboxypeptidase/D-alanyl-D-alanine-endopeptidase [Pedococcus sp. 2YAF34]|uniref:D-alanyl-D-alanine carboxypeptidase/D-alanyl-D-alanine-endopeptidase n=1 Tax=Pedococcus sp. 2YAF34 TaxID=3233032 RepID=UPI003F999E29